MRGAADVQEEGEGSGKRRQGARRAPTPQGPWTVRGERPPVNSLGGQLVLQRGLSEAQDAARVSARRSLEFAEKKFVRGNMGATLQPWDFYCPDRWMT